MSTYTPGPWIADEVGDSGGENPISVYEVTTADGHRRVCEHLYEADARLVSCAPDLLEALRDLANLHSYAAPIEKKKAAYLKARAAIAKATGK